MSKWVVNLEEDPETGDLILPLSDEILTGTGWKTGDVLEWIDNENGSWTIRKKEIKMKFTFIAEHDSGEKITYESEKEFLHDVVSDFELFLRGCGFYFDGVLDFVDEPKYDAFEGASEALDNLDTYWRNAVNTQPVVNTDINIDSTIHTEEFFNTERNR